MDQLNEIVKFILYKSRQSNHPLTQVMAYYIAQIILNPRTNRFYLEDKLTESEMREVKELALKRIYNRDFPAMKTIQLQITYDTTFNQQQKERQDESREQSNENGRLIDQVISLQVKNAKDFQGVSQLYKKVFNYLLHKAKEHSNPLDIPDKIFNIEKEVAAALESIIPRAALSPFVSLNPTQKMNQLIQLSNLVQGIRLFNQEIAKGGATLIPVKMLLQHPGRDLLRQIRKQASQIIQLCQNYSMVFVLEQAQITSVGNSQEMRRLKDQLTFLRQYLSYVISLQEEIEISENTVEINQTRFKKQISDLKNLLGTKTSAPKQQVYPKFAAVSNSFIQLFDQKKMSVGRIKLFNLLTEFRKGFAITMPIKFINIAKNMNSAALSALSVPIDYTSETGVDRLLPHQSPDFMQTPLDYLGFCVWSIVKCNGLLLSGKPNLGVYRYKDKNCVFSSQKCVNQFLRDPDTFIEGVVDQCRLNPQLIHLLRMEDSFRSLDLSINFNVAEGGTAKNKMMVDKSCQTPTHFVEKLIDPDYCWNQWELRKKAIQMANIRKRTTQACQTILSHYRADSQIQTYLPKETGVNTMQQHGFSAERHSIQTYDKQDMRERPRVYIVGIRQKKK